MKTSQRGIDALCKEEGYRARPYLCSAGVPTIGYGSTFYTDGRKVKIGDEPIDKEEAETLLKHTLEKTFEPAINRLVTAPLLQTQFDALILLVYNIGVGAFEKSTALKRLNQGDYEGAAEAMQWFCKERVRGEVRVNRGLQMRRAREAKMFLESAP